VNRRGATSATDKLNSYRKVGNLLPIQQVSNRGVFRTGLWSEYASTDRYQTPSDPRTWIDAALPNFHEKFGTATLQPYAEYEVRVTPVFSVTPGFKMAYYKQNFTQFADNGKTVGSLNGAPFVTHAVTYHAALPSIDGRYLLFVGALDARKDPRALLDAWTAARVTHPDLRLLIAGAPGRQAPPSMSGAIQLGRVDDEELADLYSAASCLLFPSRYEGFGLPCLEAMACGCPVAAFRNSSIPEVVNAAGMMVEDGNGRALGDAAAAMIREPDRWRRAGLQQARKFSWDRTARETISAYQSLLA